MALRLVVELGDRVVRHPLGDGEHLVGSSPECSVRLDHPAVSRRHALIRIQEGSAEIEDLGSTNGTKVDGRRIREACELEPGRALDFGTVSGRLEQVAAEDLEAAVRLEPAEPRSGPGPGDAASFGAPASTAASGSLQTFALHRLPHLVELVADGVGTERMAQAVGAALHETLPCLSLTVETARLSSDAAGVLFTVRTPRSQEAANQEADPARDAARTEVVGEGRRARIRATFAHPLHGRAYRPLIETAARLIDLVETGGTSRRRSAPDRTVSPRPESPPPLPEPPTVEPAVRQLYADAARVAHGGVSVLIRGASGTGKEVLARWIHAASPRAGKPFIALNCAALPGDLLEAELFGIERGVATGVDSRPGKLELADGGTLFLDEIGDMAPQTQAKILRALQEGEVYRLGGTEPRSARVRTLAASNRDLDALLEQGSFRTDLYHRIADWTVTLPTLAERPGDIPNLAAHFLARQARERGLAVAGISRGALEALERYPWPGNIRQLEREMSRAVLFLEDGELLESSHLAEPIREGSRKGLRDGPRSLKERLEEVERQAIRRALARNDGDVPAVAEELGLGRSTLYRRIKELGVSVGQVESARK